MGDCPSCGQRILPGETHWPDSEKPGHCGVTPNPQVFWLGDPGPDRFSTKTTLLSRNSTGGEKQASWKPPNVVQDAADSSQATTAKSAA